MCMSMSEGAHLGWIKMVQFDEVTNSELMIRQKTEFSLTTYLDKLPIVVLRVHTRTTISGGRAFECTLELLSPVQLRGNDHAYDGKSPVDVCSNLLVSDFAP